ERAYPLVGARPGGQARADVQVLVNAPLAGNVGQGVGRVRSGCGKKFPGARAGRQHTASQRPVGGEVGPAAEQVVIGTRQVRGGCIEHPTSVVILVWWTSEA